MIKRTNGKITYGSVYNGYLCISTYNINDATRHNLRVHRLVIATFHGRNDNLLVNHKDGNKKNNCPENLEYMTNSENTLYAISIGLRTYKSTNTRSCIQLTMDGK